MNNIVIFASGSGSNAENVINYFKNDPRDRVIGLCCNKPDAPVLARAERLGVPVCLFNREEFYGSDRVLLQLEEWQADLIVLAGFLWKVPENILETYAGRVINIHPALLPQYGGKGMYGMRVHEAVIAAGEGGSGITIHYVNECYDEGGIIFQAMCAITPEDTPESLAGKVHALEYDYFPRIIKGVLDEME